MLALRSQPTRMPHHSSPPTTQEATSFPLIDVTGPSSRSSRRSLALLNWNRLECADTSSVASPDDGSSRVLDARTGKPARLESVPSSSRKWGLCAPRTCSSLEACQFLLQLRCLFSLSLALLTLHYLRLSGRLDLSMYIRYPSSLSRIYYLIVMVQEFETCMHIDNVIMHRVI